LLQNRAQQWYKVPRFDGQRHIVILSLCLDLTSSGIRQQPHADNIRFASVGTHNGQPLPVLSQSGWIDNRHYIILSVQQWVVYTGALKFSSLKTTLNVGYYQHHDTVNETTKLSLMNPRDVLRRFIWVTGHRQRFLSGRVGSGRVGSWVSETGPVSHPFLKFYRIFAFYDWQWKYSKYWKYSWSSYYGSVCCIDNGESRRGAEGTCTQIPK